MEFTQEEKNRLAWKRSLANVAYAFLIVETVLTSWFLITLAWMIPMTIAAHNHSLYPSRNSSLALGICSIIFMWPFGLIAGILLIIAHAKTDDIVHKAQGVEILK